MKLVSNFIRRKLEKENKKRPLLTGPLQAVVHFRIPLPKAIHGQKRKKRNGFPHTKKPDGDNLEKFLNDSFNGILWDDDARLAWVTRSKTETSDNEGSTIVFVKQIPNAYPDYKQILKDIEENIEIESEIIEVEDDSDTTESN